MKPKPTFDRDAYIAELEGVISELEKLHKTNTVQAMLYEKRRELRFWKAHKSYMLRLGREAKREI